jgi:hypothetical protein
MRLAAVALGRLSVITPFFLGEPFVVELGKREGLEKRKKRRYTLCTRVNRDLLNYVLTSTDILPRFYSMEDMNYVMNFI